LCMYGSLQCAVICREMGGATGKRFEEELSSIASLPIAMAHGARGTLSSPVSTHLLFPANHATFLSQPPCRCSPPNLGFLSHRRPNLSPVPSLSPFTRRRWPSPLAARPSPSPLAVARPDLLLSSSGGAAFPLVTGCGSFSSRCGVMVPFLYDTPSCYRRAPHDLCRRHRPRRVGNGGRGPP
jgi:hypothetical protein